MHALHFCQNFGIVGVRLAPLLKKIREPLKGFLCITTDNNLCSSHILSMSCNQFAVTVTDVTCIV